MDDKLTTLADYGFNLCHENALNLRGYMTEKIFDVSHGECVPIHLGATDIAELIPLCTCIDRRNFASHAELLKFIRNLGEAEWQGFIDAVWQFLQSEKYKDIPPTACLNCSETG